MTPRQKLGAARVRTFDYVPYLASHIYTLRERETPGIKTAAVDEDANLYWDAEFVEKHSVEELAYTITHEAVHLIFEHHARAHEIFGEKMTEQERFIANVAADLVIEQTLSNMRKIRPACAVHLGCKVPQLGGMVLDFPENRSMQEYIRLIIEKMKPQGEDGSEDGDEQQGGDMEQPPVTGGDEPKDKGKKKPDPKGQGGSGQDASGQGEEEPGPCSPGSGGSAADGKPRPYEIEPDGAWESYGKQSAAAAIEKYEQSNPGSVPGNILAEVAETLRPQPDPFDVLRSAVCSSVASTVGGRDFSRRRRSRKQPQGEDQPLLHGRMTVQPRAVVIVDTSASMMCKDVYAKAITVISQGLRKLGQVRVYCGDTTLQSNEMVRSCTRFDWKGGGGTDMSKVLMEVDEADKPDAIVLITDAETHWSPDMPRGRVVVAYTGKRGSRWETSIPKKFKVVPLVKKGA